jgi:hypothetical protein
LYRGREDSTRRGDAEESRWAYSFTESNRQRVLQLEGNQGVLITRVGVLEDRVLELKRKVNFPGHPPQ